MKPDWDRLMREYQSSTTAGVYDVDCTGAGKSLCQQAGVRGYPTILHGEGNVAGLQKYSGGRTFDALSRFARTSLEGDRSAGKEPAEKTPPAEKGPPPPGKGRAGPRAPPSGKKTAPPGARAPGRGKRPPPFAGKTGLGTPPVGRKPFASAAGRGAKDAKMQAAAARRHAAARAKKGGSPPPAKSQKTNQQRTEAHRRAAERKRQGDARRQGAQAAARRQQQEKARAVNSNLKSKEL